MTDPRLRAAAARTLAVAVFAAALAAGGACRRDPPAAGPPDRERGIRACVVLEGCGYDSLLSFATNLICADTLLGSAYGLRPVIEVIRDCVIAASELGSDPCSAVAACLNGGAAPPPCGVPGTSCSGDVVVGCALNARTELDCAAAGSTCVVNTSGDAACGSESCIPGMFPASCDGTSVVQCDADGVAVAVDCGATGLVCASDASSGSAFCAGAGEACDEATFADSCADAHAIYCIGGAIADSDCAALVEGYVCATVAPGAVDCVPPASDCVDVADDDCDGSTIVLCVDRREWRYDCVALGFTGCEVVDNLPYCF